MNIRKVKGAMLQEKLKKLLEENCLSMPTINGDIPHGDMPGDKVEIGEDHIQKANVIIKTLIPMMAKQAKEENKEKFVLTVCGGSGVGKSEIASLLSYYFNENGIGSYTMSGDNYPVRIPMYNDAERLRIFRYCGQQQMLADGVYSEENFKVLHEFMKNGDDANKSHIADYPWMESYIKGGRKGLEGYLGTTNETNFAEVEGILAKF
ncbi:MAG: adenylylsulfate kinase, partial [Lachnospiraceae bacterium]|nr:adenylylsulfate kinase [Lachnospiraceae bacterium]